MTLDGISIRETKKATKDFKQKAGAPPSPINEPIENVSRIESTQNMPKTLHIPELSQLTKDLNTFQHTNQQQMDTIMVYTHFLF